MTTVTCNSPFFVSSSTAISHTWYEANFYVSVETGWKMHLRIVLLSTLRTNSRAIGSITTINLSSSSFVSSKMSLSKTAQTWKVNWNSELIAASFLTQKRNKNVIARLPSSISYPLQWVTQKKTWRVFLEPRCGLLADGSGRLVVLPDSQVLNRRQKCRGATGSGWSWCRNSVWSRRFCWVGSDCSLASNTSRAPGWYAQHSRCSWKLKSYAKKNAVNVFLNHTRTQMFKDCSIKN